MNSIGGAGAGLAIGAVALQSLGKVLYGTFLEEVAAPLFVAISVSCTVLICLASAGQRLPRHGRGMLVLTNIWTAMGFLGIFFALKHLPPAIFAALEIGLSLIAAMIIASFTTAAWPRPERVATCLGIITGCGLLAIAELSDEMPAPTTDSIDDILRSRCGDRRL